MLCVWSGSKHFYVMIHFMWIFVTTMRCDEHARSILNEIENNMASLSARSLLQIHMDLNCDMRDVEQRDE